MPFVELDDDTYGKIELKARDAGKSVHEFTNGIIKEYLGNEWPNGYFDLIGSLKNDPLGIPEELPWELDSPREGP